jgi:hypothetical protein
VTIYDWTSIKRRESEQAFEEYHDLVMCCSSTQYTENKGICAVCGGDHLSVERRIRCVSGTCDSARVCPVVWKVRHCSATDNWEVLVCDASHGRGALPCGGEHPPRVTPAMKLLFEKEDEAMLPPRVIETRHNHDMICEPARGWPSHEQIVNGMGGWNVHCGDQACISGHNFWQPLAQF